MKIKTFLIVFTLLILSKTYSQTFTPYEYFFLPEKPATNTVYNNILPFGPINGFTLESAESYQLVNNSWMKFYEIKFESNANGRITKVIRNWRNDIIQSGLNNKEELNYIYDDKGRMIERNGRILYEYDNEWVYHNTFRFEFDDNGRISASKVYLKTDGEWLNYQIRNWEYTDKAVYESYQNLKNGQWEIHKNYIVYYLNSRGDIIKRYFADQFVDSYKYDEWGNFLGYGGDSEEESYKYNNKNQLIKVYDTYEYDQFGNLIKQKSSIAPAHGNFSSNEIIYSEFGLPIESRTYIWNRLNDSEFDKKLIIHNIYSYKKFGAARKQINQQDELVVNQNYPNPFNLQTIISFYLNSNSYVKIDVFDMLGRKVKGLIDGPRNFGLNNIPFIGSNLASGTYIYRINITNAESGESYSSSHKMILLK